MCPKVRSAWRGNRATSPVFSLLSRELWPVEDEQTHDTTETLNMSCAKRRDVSLTLSFLFLFVRGGREKEIQIKKPLALQATDWSIRGLMFVEYWFKDSSFHCLLLLVVSLSSAINRETTGLIVVFFFLRSFPAYFSWAAPVLFFFFNSSVDKIVGIYQHILKVHPPPLLVGVVIWLRPLLTDYIRLLLSAVQWCGRPPPHLSWPLHCIISHNTKWRLNIREKKRVFRCYKEE